MDKSIFNIIAAGIMAGAILIVPVDCSFLGGESCYYYTTIFKAELRIKTFLYALQIIAAGGIIWSISQQIKK